MGWGVFAVDRGLWTHPFFKPEAFTEREAWIWLISAAAWREVRVNAGGKVAQLRRAEICHSIRFMAEKWRWDKDRVDRFLKRLIKHDMLRDTSRDGVKIYFVINYNVFNRAGAPERDSNSDSIDDTRATAMRQQCDKEESFNHSNRIQESLPDVPSGAAALDAPKLANKNRYSRDFEEFWTAYPTDKNMSKHMAFKAWERLSRGDRCQAIAAVPRYIAWIKTQTNYRTLHAVRFLTQRRFEGFAAAPAADAAAIEAAKDRADRLLRRGKYADQEAA